MRLRVLALSFLIWLASVATASADSLILIHGYLGSAGSWRGTGITRVLQRRGWLDAGHLRLGPRGVMSFDRTGPKARRFYTIALPSEAPVPLQANMLSGYISWIAQRHPKEPIILAGHSAGGVVGRFAMVTSARGKVAGLITIASPHMGTRLAQLGSAVANSPLSWVAPFFGGNTINRSRRLYANLSPEKPGNLLGWLNRQPHPRAQYVSIVRVKNANAPAGGDSFVLGWSQDMNSVPALRGKSKRIFSLGEHDLRPADGMLLANILNKLRL